MWKLVIEDDEGKRTVVPLSRDDYTIGRQEGNTIRLTERNVSRTHGRVRYAKPDASLSPVVFRRWNTPKKSLRRSNLQSLDAP